MVFITSYILQVLDGWLHVILLMQDVLLYNFFGTSPLKNQWRVIYGYMKEHCRTKSTELISFPSFDDAKHNILCSELKQLYVAITRTRQRLWICESTEEYCQPVFDYWKSLCLVQERRLDCSFAEAMRSTSSPEEWKARGIKVCFHLVYLIVFIISQNHPF